LKLFHQTTVKQNDIFYVKKGVYKCKIINCLKFLKILSIRNKIDMIDRQCYIKIDSHIVNILMWKIGESCVR